MIKEIRLYKDKYNNDSNEEIKILSFQEKEENINNKVKYLRKKRKIFKKKKNLKKLNLKYKPKSLKKKADEICIICLDTISFQNQHFLHCGHNFHCSCITRWINDRNNLCPICRQDIKCNYLFNEETNLNLEENDNNNENNINNSNSQYIINFVLTYQFTVAILYLILKHPILFIYFSILIVLLK